MSWKSFKYHFDSTRVASNRCSVEQLSSIVIQKFSVRGLLRRLAKFIYVTSTNDCFWFMIKVFCRNSKKFLFSRYLVSGKSFITIYDWQGQKYNSAEKRQGGYKDFS